MGDSDDFPYKVIIHDIPGISKQKLRNRLQELTNTTKIGLTYITRSSAKVSFDNRETLDRFVETGFTIKFGENIHHIRIIRMEDQSYEAVSDAQYSQAGLAANDLTKTYSYEPSEKSDKNVLRYVYRTANHKQGLEDHLARYRIRLQSSTEYQIELESIQGERSPSSYLQCVQEFLSNFSSWNEELSCSNEDGTFIIRTLAQYKPECFGNWYPNTKTILVTGPNAIIQQIKNVILQKISQNESEGLSSPTERAHPFNYSNVSPGVMRFVKKQRLPELRQHLGGLAHVDITTKEKITSVQLTPLLISSELFHSQFSSNCIRILDKYFSMYKTWKDTFDVAMVLRKQSEKPSFFRENSERDRHIKWFPNTGSVNVSGDVNAVDEIRQDIESMFGISPRKPSHNSESDQASPFHSADSVSKLETDRRTRNFSSGSDQAAYARPVTANRKLSCSTEDIPRSVLLFILNNLKTKKRFEKCCLPVAKAVIRCEKIEGSEKMEISLFANLLQECVTPKMEEETLQSIRNFFDQFGTQTRKYNKWKLRDLMTTAGELLKSVNEELYIKPFPETGTVKITGITEKVTERLEEVEMELDSTIITEEVPSADIYIAQRECSVWDMVENACIENGLRVSVSSNQPGKIDYKGNKKAIKAAKIILGDVSQKLYEQQISGFSTDQIKVLRNCEESQSSYIDSKTNLLDLVYQHFKDNSAFGSIIFNDAHISLISVDLLHWRKCNDILRKFIVKFNVEAMDNLDISMKKFCLKVKNALKDEAVYVKERTDEKRLEIHCFESRKHGINRKVKEMMEQNQSAGKIERFYKISEEKGSHFLKYRRNCKADTIHAERKNGEYHLVITCEKEDLDTVEMQLTDFLEGIVSMPYQIEGRFLYDSLKKSGELLRIQEDTQSSIFLQAVKEKQSEIMVTVKQGNILDEKCNAIVNSTGNGLNFSSSSQVNKALVKKYGGVVFQQISSTREKLVKNQAAIFDAIGSGLPWQFIINIATPSRSDALTTFIVDLLKALNKRRVKSLALPTIGTGNLGLNPSTVADCMKKAFETYCSTPGSKNLKDIRVVVYDVNLLQLFSSLVTEQGDSSVGICGNILANSKQHLDKAYKELNKICKDSITKEVIRDTVVPEFSSFVRQKTEEICKDLIVHLKWKNDGMQDLCILEGPVGEVQKAKDKIEKLLATGPNWTPMTSNKPFERVALDPSSSEYKAVEMKFKRSSPSYAMINQIERIQNPLQYQQFRARKTSKLNGGITRDLTRQLFHGTNPESVDGICQQGFNRTYAGQNGKVYGSGVYFHVNSSYSQKYAGNSPVKYIFLADVITGEYTKGSSDLRCAPKNPRTGADYDSVVDSTEHPQIFVVFPDSSCYPLYLISFY